MPTPPCRLYVLVATYAPVALICGATRTCVVQLGNTSGMETGWRYRDEHAAPPSSPSLRRMRTL